MFRGMFVRSKNALKNASKLVSAQNQGVSAWTAAACTKGENSKKAVASSAFIVALASGAAMASNCMYADKEKKPMAGLPGTSSERTFIAIKPDGVERGLINEVIARFEKKGYKLVAMKMMTATEAQARDHYADLASRPFYPGLVKYFSSGPIVCMIWEGNDVILTGRKILGATNPNQADPGTLRGDNCISTGRNLVHGSDGVESAAHEINMWWTADEISDYERAIDTWIVANN